MEWLNNFEHELSVMMAKDKDFELDLKFVKLPYEKKTELDMLDIVKFNYLFSNVDQVLFFYPNSFLFVHIGFKDFNGSMVFD